MSSRSQPRAAARRRQIEPRPKRLPPVSRLRRTAAPSAGCDATPTGRFVPPTIRLRVEEPGQAPPTAPPLPEPQPRPLVTQPPRAAPPARTPPRSDRQPGAAGRVHPRPRAGSRARAVPRSTTPAMLGGPRPLPSQPVRPEQPGGRRARGIPAASGYSAASAFPSVRRSAAAPGGRRERPRRAAARPSAPPPITRTITLAEGMTVKDLADKLEVARQGRAGKLLMMPHDDDDQLDARYRDATSSRASSAPRSRCAASSRS